MTIYVLHGDLNTSAKYLDDRSLDRCFKTIAQVLCNVWYDYLDENIPPEANYNEIPLDTYGYRREHKQWTKWACKSKANYEWLVEYAGICLREASFRSSDPNYLKSLDTWFKIIIWTHDTVPKLSEDAVTPLPLVMPKKYIYNPSFCNYLPLTDMRIILYLYKRYYEHTAIKANSLWTNRTRPLELRSY